MKKEFLVLFIIILLGKGSFAQDYAFGLFSKSYLHYIGNTDRAERVKKNIYIIYNRGFCIFYVEGKGSFFFKIRNYTEKLDGEYIHTDFVSEETNTTPDAYYGILIDKSKDETIFQVSLPNGYTYIVNDAKVYSQNGLVKNNPYIKNYKEFDSLSKVKPIK